MKRVSILEIEHRLAEYLRLAEQEDIVILRHGRPVGVLVGFANEDEWINYRLKHDDHFLARITGARYRYPKVASLNLEELTIEW